MLNNSKQKNTKDVEDDSILNINISNKAETLTGLEKIKQMRLESGITSTDGKHVYNDDFNTISKRSETS